MREAVSRKLVEKLLVRLEGLMTLMERNSLAELIELYRSPRRMIFLSFASGVARGFGIAAGFTIIGALFLWMLGRADTLIRPIIGECVAELSRLDQREWARA